MGRGGERASGSPGGAVGPRIRDTSPPMFAPIASLVTRRSWIVLVAWTAVTAVLWTGAPKWESVNRDDDVRFFPAGSPSVVGAEMLERGFPADAASCDAVVIVERAAGRLTDADFTFIQAMSRRLRTLVNLKFDTPEGVVDRAIRKVTDYREPVLGPRLIGNAREGPGQVALTIVSIRSTYVSKQTRLAVDRIEEELAKLGAIPAGLTVKKLPIKGLGGVETLPVSGSALVGHDTNQALTTSMNATTGATIVLVVLILLLVYKSPLLALTPLVTIALSVVVSLKALATLTLVPGLHFQVMTVTQIFVVVVLFGAGTDYCLFLIARYREELARGRAGDEALGEAIRQVGGALMASAGTVIVGLGMLSFSSFAKISYTGPAVALCLAIALTASLTLSPVLLHWLRGAVFWPFRPPHHETGADPEEEGQHETPMFGFWAGVADVVVRRPILILSLSLAALTPFAIIGSRTKSNYGQLTDLKSDQPSIIGTRIISRYFPVGELGRTTVLIDQPRLDFRTAAGREAVAELTRKLSALKDVAEVRSVAEPLGPPPRDRFARFRQSTLIGLLRPQVDDRYVSTNAKESADRGHITRIEVAFRTDPFSEESLGTLEEVRRVVGGAIAGPGPLAGARSGLGGATVMIRDLKATITRDERRMYVLVTGGVYLILVILLRRPGICLYLIATVVLGYLASLGMSELVFRALHGGPEAWVGLDWKVGFFLFVILVAVGEDYNILLMARVLEEERKRGPIEGTRRAVAHTGGIISSCGLIMACTFGSMLTGSLLSLQELGFALGLGVLLDTFIVRPVLVPAFVVLLHRNRPGPAPTPTPMLGPVDRAEAASAT